MRWRCRFNPIHLGLGVVFFQLATIIFAGLALLNEQWYDVAQIQFIKLALNPVHFIKSHGLFPKPLSEKQTHLDRIVAAFLVIGMVSSLSTMIVFIIFYVRYLGLCCLKFKTPDGTLFNILLGLTWITTFIMGLADVIFWMWMPHRIVVNADNEVTVTQMPGGGIYLTLGSFVSSFWSIPFAVLLELVLQKVDFY